MKGTFWHISYSPALTARRHPRPATSNISCRRSHAAPTRHVFFSMLILRDTRYLVDTRWWIGHWKSLSTRHEQSGKRSKLSPILRKSRLIWVLLQATDACFFSPDYRNERWNELRCCFYCRLKWITFLEGWLKTASIEINRNGIQHFAEAAESIQTKRRHEESHKKLKELLDEASCSADRLFVAVVKLVLCVHVCCVCVCFSKFL